jgi:hypothetical protein
LSVNFGRNGFIKSAPAEEGEDDDERDEQEHRLVAAPPHGVVAELCHAAEEAAAAAAAGVSFIHRHFGFETFFRANFYRRFVRMKFVNKLLFYSTGISGTDPQLF